MFKLKESHKSKDWIFALSLQTAREYHKSEPNLLHIAFFNRSYWIEIPEILRPKMKWVDTSKYEWGGPNSGYWDAIMREYGFYANKEALHVHYGIQPGSWSRVDKENSDHSKCFFLPWNEQRRMYIDYLNPDKTLFERYFDNKNGSINFDEMNRIRDALPKIKFSFKDFDGEENVATCYLETSMYRQGTSWCMFLGYIFKPQYYRKMDIEFAKETGRQKGSYKGGTMGTSTTIEPWESPEEAFKRYGSSTTHEKHYGEVNREFSDVRIIE